MKWDCPVCRYVEDGGRPIIGKVCEDCKSNALLMDRYNVVATNFTELVMESFSVFLTLVMMLVITRLWYCSLGVTLQHLATSLLVWVVLVSVQYENVKQNYKRYKELRGEERAEALFVLKVKGSYER